VNKRVKTALRRMEMQRFPSGDLLTERLAAASVWQHRRTPGTAVPRGWIRRTISRRAALVGGLATVAGAGFGVPLLLGGTAYAATPPLLVYEPPSTPITASAVFVELAARARTQPRPVVPLGSYHYQHIRSWNLGVASDSDREIFESKIFEVDREQWIAEDGSGRLKINDGTPLAGDRTYAPGELFAGFIANEVPIETLRSIFDVQDTPIGRLKAASDHWRRQVPLPEQQANLLTLLAGEPGMAVLGETTDRAGRQGVAIAAEDENERHILVFAHETGALIDAELIARQPMGLPIQAPATIEYTVWVATGHTATIEQRP
jgi:hypothetical protein